MLGERPLHRERGLSQVSVGEVELVAPRARRFGRELRRSRQWMRRSALAGHGEDVRVRHMARDAGHAELGITLRCVTVSAERVRIDRERTLEGGVGEGAAMERLSPLGRDLDVAPLARGVVRRAGVRRRMRHRGRRRRAAREERGGDEEEHRRPAAHALDRTRDVGWREHLSVAGRDPQP